MALGAAPSWSQTPTFTDSPTDSPTDTPTLTPTNTTMSTATFSPTLSVPTDTPTITPTDTSTDTPTPANTPTNTNTPSPTLSPTAIPWPNACSSEFTGWNTSTNVGANVVCTPMINVVGPGTAPNSNGLLSTVPPGQAAAYQLYSGRGDSGHQDWARVCANSMVPTSGLCCLTFDVAAIFEDYHFNTDQTPNNDSYLEVQIFVGGTCGGGQLVYDLLFSYQYVLASGLVTLDGLADNNTGTVGGAGGCQVNPNNTCDWGFMPWTPYTVNLCAFAGQQCNIVVTEYDCGQGGHYGWGYFDCPHWISCPSPSIQLTKTNIPTGLVDQGATLTYNLSYQNTGADPIDGVVVNDTIPAGTSLLSGSVTSNPYQSVTQLVGSDLIWDIGYLAAGVSGTLSFSVTVNPIRGGCQASVTNIAEEGNFETQPSTLLSNAVTNATGGTCTATPTITDTPIFTYTFTFTQTITDTNTATSTGTATATSTATSTDTSTVSSTPTNSPTQTATATATATATITDTPTASFTFTPSYTPTHTATVTDTFTPTNTATITDTPTHTATATPGIQIQKLPSETTAQPGDTLSYQILLTVTGSADSNVRVTDSLPAQVAFVAFGAPSPTVPGQNMVEAGSLLTWTFPALNPGVYQLPYTVTVGSNLTVQTVLLNNAQEVFQGGQPQSVTAPVTVAFPYQVQVGIYNEAGELIKTLTVPNLSQGVGSIQLSSPSLTDEVNAIAVSLSASAAVSWDGTNQGGTLVSNGQYYIKVQSTGPSGVVTTVTRTVAVSRSLATLSVEVYNEAGEVVKTIYQAVTVNGAGSLQALDLSQPVIAPGGPSSTTGTPSNTMIFLTVAGATVTLAWDGTTDQGQMVVSGQYLVEARWVGGAEDQTIIKQISVIGGRGSSGPLQAQPNVISGGQTTTVFSVGSSSSLTLKLRVYDTAGELAAAAEGGTGTNLVSFNAAGLANGLYIAVADLEGPNGFEGRQTTRFVVLH